MKFGYHILNTYVPELDGESAELYAHWLEQIDAAESLGFDSLWVTEHHFRYFGGMLPNPQLLLAAAAGRTKRMRLGAAVSLLPMHHPLQIAEDFAMVDLLSAGRLNFGAGRGMHPLEYSVFNADWTTAQQRLPEALDVIVRAWTDDAFEWKSEHYRYPKLNVYPKPAQRPHPPIYVTANRDPESFRMIGQRGYHLMTLPWIATNELQRTRVELYLEALRDGGHAVESKDIFVMYPAYVSDSDAQARLEVLEHWNRWREFALDALGLDATKGEAYHKVFRHLDYDAMIADNRGVFGGPDSCIRILKKIIKVVGATHVGLTFHFGGVSQHKVIRSMERFTRQVMPALRQACRTNEHSS
ncbi:MAG TPA: LLM class flavin-dependent oxidoreductase [Candidatus Udaeobacter sp.]|nr:LLM class flavin-dependent oxidoreductase [Candidatus Udaeobacter sp.]